MTPERKRLLATLIRECTSPPGSSPLLGQVQGLSVYTPAGQKAYVEAYLPKQVGCWRYVRAQLCPKPLAAPTVSIGAGPRLCLWGWSFDYPPTPHDIVAVDVLDWGAVTRMPEFLEAEEDVLGGNKPIIHEGRYFPEDFVPPQCSQLPSITPFQTSSISQPSWLLFPFFFGHLLDRDGKITDPQMGQLGQRLRDLVAAGNVVVVVDKAGGTKGTDWFWSDLVGKTLGYAPPTPIPVFDSAAHTTEFVACYDDPATGGYRINTTRASGFGLCKECPTPIWIT
jgi:hypothetical protein